MQTMAKKYVFGSRQFTYDANTKMFVGEVSTLSLNEMAKEIFIKSAKTGFVKRFDFERTSFVHGELAAWIYSADGIEVHILND